MLRFSHPCALSHLACAASLAVALVTFATSGCDKWGMHDRSCNDMGCGPTSASLTLPAALTEDGDYTFDVTSDGETLNCTATLPFQWASPVCDEGLSLLVEGPTATTGSSVSQGPADRISGLLVVGVLGEVSVKVTRNGSLVYAGSATPAYEGVEINGPGCGECVQGSASLP